MPKREDIVVVADGSAGRPAQEAFEVLAFASRLRCLTRTSVQVWILGREDDADALAGEIARRGGVAVTVLHAPGLLHYCSEAYWEILGPRIRAAAPAYVVTAHTSRGAEWVPAVAAGIGAACITGVDDLEWHDGRVCFIKDRYGGKLKGRYISKAGTTLLTVQPDCFAFDNRPLGLGEGTVTRKVVAWCPKKTRFEGTEPAAPANVKLTDAHVLVAAGNGIGAQENLQWIQRLAQCLPNAAVAGSRIVCDRGWLSYDRQVGVTGATVTPALYIACGISGAAQHLSGMRGSGFVVSINSDSRAPMGFEADLRIVEDLTTFIPKVLELLEKRLIRTTSGYRPDLI